MLGLNNIKTLYQTTAYYYKKKEVKANVLSWEETPRTFKCNFVANSELAQIASNQGTRAVYLTIETNSPITFLENDKIAINGNSYLVKSVSIQNNPLSAMYKNTPQAFIKTITLG